MLAEVVADLRPGRALDLGCGQGGDTLGLAALGWQVTAVDVSQTALPRVRDRARAAGVLDRVTLEQHDLARTVPEGTHDLVSAAYLQSPVDLDRAAMLRRVARNVAPGGVLLLLSTTAPPHPGRGTRTRTPGSPPRQSCSPSWTCRRSSGPPSGSTPRTARPPVPAARSPPSPTPSSASNASRPERRTTMTSNDSRTHPGPAPRTPSSRIRPMTSGPPSWGSSTTCAGPSPASSRGHQNPRSGRPGCPRAPTCWAWSSM